MSADAQREILYVINFTEQHFVTGSSGGEMHHSSEIPGHIFNFPALIPSWIQLNWRKQFHSLLYVVELLVVLL